MKLSRRDALRTAGGLALVGLAGCVEERVTERETRIRDRTISTLSPQTEALALSREEFDDYVDTMADRYGDGGVWGAEADRGQGFERAYVQRHAITHETARNPTERELSFGTEAFQPDAPILIADACLAMYDLGDGRHRYWLWTAADSTDARLVGDATVDTLSIGVRSRNGILADAVEPVVEDGRATVDLGSTPSGTFPLEDGTIETTAVLGEGGEYAVTWQGDREGVQSINGVLEEERPDEYDLFWTTSLGYRTEETV